MATDPLLEARGLVKQFGGISAIDGLDLHIQSGEILGALLQCGNAPLQECVATPLYRTETLLLNGPRFAMLPDRLRVQASGPRLMGPDRQKWSTRFLARHERHRVLSRHRLTTDP